VLGSIQDLASGTDMNRFDELACCILSVLRVGFQLSDSPPTLFGPFPHLIRMLTGKELNIMYILCYSFPCFTIFGKIEDDDEASGEKSGRTDKFHVQVFLK
jgi:hypothetical protein